MKFLISIPLSVGTVIILYYLKETDGDWMTLSALTILLGMCYTRVAEYILKLPMWSPSWFGTIRQWKTISPEQKFRRLSNLLLYLTLIPIVGWLYFQLDAKDDPVEEDSTVEEIYDSAH